ncbi:unnamed protein product [Ceratitis capitata]|uniref:(Mediterranean fruit fly) hypothetical protein n=1 Tax=Ceratitis capitata TaxID=7213 RepID=A0A811V7M1_CERCA|nr:unnamed protein product [Ceratitis capitata]
MGDSEEDQEVDHEAAVLIAAAAEADCGTYIEDATGQILRLRHLARVEWTYRLANPDCGQLSD